LWEETHFLLFIYIMTVYIVISKRNIN
jgi:hypothetical protein